MKTCEEQEAAILTPVKTTNPDRLNSSQRRLLSVIASHQAANGYAELSKRELSALLDRCARTVDMVVADLRRCGLIEATLRHAPTGGQIASTYRVTDLAREKYPELVGYERDNAA